jgi:predicted nucleotidyltransferase
MPRTLPDSDASSHCGLWSPLALRSARSLRRSASPSRLLVSNSSLPPELGEVHPEILLEAAAPVLKALANEHGYTRLAVFGSLARGQARPDSDIDLIVKAPEGTSTFGFIGFKQLVEQVLDRQVDLIDYCGLKPRVDVDICREAVLL